MTQFNTTRFLSVAKWDLAINRPFYLKAALFILLILALPALFSLLELVTIEPIEALYFRQDPTASVAVDTIHCYFAMLPILFGYTLHNLRSRQGRILELTLPASCAEKYVWHVCLTLLGSLCVAVVSFFVIDLVYNLCLGLLVGFSYSEEFIVSMLRNAIFPIYDVDDEVVCLLMLPYLFFLSTFLLGNSWKYRHNVVLTIAWDFAIIFLIIITAGLAFWHIILRFMEVHDTAAHRMADFIDSPACEVVIILVELCLIVLCWAWAYRLYRRATITSRRNP